MAKKAKQSIIKEIPELTPVPDAAKEQTLSESTVQELTASPQTPEEVPLEKANKRFFIFGSVILVIVVLASGLLYYGAYQIKPQKTIVTKVIKQSKPVPQEVVQLKRNEITLEIFNGSGVAGLASKTAKKFENLGYQTLKTGNSETLKENQLLVSNRDKNRVSILLQDAKEMLGINVITGELLDSTASARIIIITNTL